MPSFLLGARFYFSSSNLIFPRCQSRVPIRERLLTAAVMIIVTVVVVSQTLKNSNKTHLQLAAWFVGVEIVLHHCMGHCSRHLLLYSRVQVIP